MFQKIHYPPNEDNFVKSAYVLKELQNIPENQKILNQNNLLVHKRFVCWCLFVLNHRQWQVLISALFSQISYLAITHHAINAFTGRSITRGVRDIATAEFVHSRAS